MIKVEGKTTVVSLGAGAIAGSPLPYIVELWDLPRVAPERIIGQAASVTLARAIFAAAQREHLGRRVVLRRGSRLLQATD